MIPTVSFIGAGHMAGGIIEGLCAAEYPPDHLIATRRDSQALAKLQKKYPIQWSTDNIAAVRKADIVILGVKPYQLCELLVTLRPSLHNKKPIVVSLASGIGVDQLRIWGGESLCVIRAMPNLAVKINMGLTALYAHKHVDAQARDAVAHLFQRVGAIEWLSAESIMHLYTALVGSGPGYMFLFIELLSQAAQSLGATKDQANQWTIGMMQSATMLAAKSSQPVDALRREVTSPNGVTEAALNVFNEYKLDAIMAKALQCAVARSKEIASNNVE